MLGDLFWNTIDKKIEFQEDHKHFIADALEEYSN